VATSGVSPRAWKRPFAVQKCGPVPRSSWSSTSPTHTGAAADPTIVIVSIVVPAATAMPAGTRVQVVAAASASGVDAVPAPTVIVTAVSALYQIASWPLIALVGGAVSGSTSGMLAVTPVMRSDG